MGEVERKYKPKIPVILLAGKAGSGKDTIASVISQELSTGLNNAVGDTATLGFADILKSVSYRNHDYVDKKSGRGILQLVGDRFREINPNVFVEVISKMIECYVEMDYSLVVISDARYQNEFDYINNHVGCAVPYTVKIVREGYNGLSEDEGAHKSENVDIEEDFTLLVPELGKIDGKAAIEKYSILVKEVRRILETIYEDYLSYR